MMPAESAIYWDSVGSQRSTSGGSSGSASSRHYVDPWDLENYAYLRRHSVAGISQHEKRPRNPKRITRESRTKSDHWYASSREPGYDAPALVEEIYYGATRQLNNTHHHNQQPIYEDETSPDYVAPFPVYAPLSELRHGESIEDHRRARQRSRSSSVKDLRRTEYVDHRVLYRDPRDLEPTRQRLREEYSTMVHQDNRYFLGMVPPSHLDLNTYGHLKIDYTNSWDSLNRKISKTS